MPPACSQEAYRVGVGPSLRASSDDDLPSPHAPRGRAGFDVVGVHQVAGRVAKEAVIRFEGRFYFPLFETYTEFEFGGVFEIEADYMDRVV